MPLPSPAPDSIRTAWPSCVSSSTPTGSIATRYSSALISLGTPTIIRPPLQTGPRPDQTGPPRAEDRPDDIRPRRVPVAAAPFDQTRPKKTSQPGASLSLASGPGACQDQRLGRALNGSSPLLAVRRPRLVARPEPRPVRSARPRPEGPDPGRDRPLRRRGGHRGLRLGRRRRDLPRQGDRGSRPRVRPERRRFPARAGP